MKNKLALFVAVILGLIAVYGIHRFIASKEQKFQEEYQSVKVASAAARIKAGTVIQANMLAGDASARVILEAALTGDHILHGQRNTLVGQTLNRNVERGTPLLASYFRKPIERLENRLGIGERAITLRVDSISGVAGNLVPGSHVDILGTFPVAGAQGGRAASATDPEGSQTLMLFANVTVLAVDNRTREVQYVAAVGDLRRAAYSSVTVAATPEEANILVYAQEYGALTLSLRPPADVTMAPPATITGKNLLPEAARAAKAREDRLKERAPMTVEETFEE